MPRNPIACVLGLLLLFVGATHAARAAGLEGKPAPLIELSTRDGTAHTLAAITAQRPAIVVFWASWCPYCKALLPELAKLVGEYGADRVAVVAINVWEESKDDAHAYMDANAFPFTWLMRGNKTAKPWKVKGTPGLFLVGRDGVVRYDRAARPLMPSAEPPPAGAAASGPAKSAMRWITELRRELDVELARTP
ncbi:MAG TPA: TlpA disulfide reductase family protein [Xanthomonadales bacterium]|nr:TlpA disulfide reductase family protein [Xanthomonadales bacterium]